MNKSYYFYRKAIEPDTCEFYDHSKGIAGYTNEQSEQHFFHGTIKELDEHLSFKRPAKVGVRGSESVELKNMKINMQVKIKSLAYVQLGVAKFISLFNEERAMRHLEWVADDWVMNPKKYMKVTFGSKRKG